MRQTPLPPSMPLRRPGLTVSLLRLTSIMIALFATIAIGRAQTSTTFHFDNTNQNFLKAFNLITLYGDAVYDNIYNGQGPPISADIYITPGQTNGNYAYGSLFYNDPIDLTQGFETSFYMPTASPQGFAFVIRNLKEKSHLTVNSSLGYSDFYRSVAIDFDFAQRQVLLQAPTNDYLTRGDNVLASAPLPFPTNGFGSSYLGTVVIRYSPKSKLLDVYLNDVLILRKKDFLLDDYKVLENGQAQLGFTGAVRTNSNDYNITANEIQTWALGNNLNATGLGEGFYSELMTFTTTAQSLWGPSSDSVSWNTGSKLITNYSQTDHQGNSTSYLDTLFDNNGTKNGVGLRFQADASGGTVDVNYPLYLNMTFPKQRTVQVNDPFVIASSYEADGTAAFNTTSPSARFRSFFTFNTHSRLKYAVDFPYPFSSFSFGGTPVDLRTSLDDTEIFDTDFILKNASLFSLVVTGGQTLVNLKNDEGVKGQTSSHSGEGEGEGSTKGAGDGVSPLDFISLNIFTPNLTANGYLDFANAPTTVKGNASSDIIGLHSDLTSALLGLAGPPGKALAALLNVSESFDFGSGINASVGWTIADLYADLNFGIQLSHTFTPAPHVHLDLTDPDGNPIRDQNNQVVTFDYNLNADGTPVDSPAIPMTFKPLTITPTVTVYDPKGKAKNNTFTTDASLVIDGDLNMTAFRMFLKASSLIDIDTGDFGYITPIPRYTSPSLGSLSYQLGGFNTVTGKSFTLLPAASKYPYIKLVTPRAVTRQTSSTGSISIALDCLSISSDAGVFWDYNTKNPIDLSGNTKVLSPTSVVLTLPDNLLLQRGTHTLTIVNGLTSLSQQFPSNRVTLTVNELVPSLDNLSPSKVTLTTPPTDSSNGAAILQNGPKGSNNAVASQYFTLTLHGHNFVDSISGTGTRLPGSIVRWGGQALQTKFVSSRQLTAQVPASFLTVKGTTTITVFNAGPGGGESRPQSFILVNPKPSAGRLGPSTSFAGAAKMTTMVHGASFVRDSKVLWNRQERPTTYFNSTQLEVELTADDLLQAGPASISVTNGGNLQSQPLTFTVGVRPVRTILQVTPNLGRNADGSVQITLTIKNIGSSPATGLALAEISLTAGKTVAAAPTDTTLPTTLGDLAPGATIAVPGTFTLPQGVKAGAAQLNVYGSFSNGPFTSRQRVTVP